MILVGGLYFLRENQMQNASLQNAPAPTIVKTWEDKTINEQNAEQNYVLTLMYPQLTGLSSSATQERINSSIQTLVNDQVVEFKKGITINPVLPTSMQEVKNELVIESTVIRADNSIVSVLFSVMQAYPGMAHPNNYNLTFNYDVENNTVLSISSLFKPDSDYVQELSNQTKKIILGKPEMKDNPNAADFVDEGASVDEANFSLFTLSDTTLTIVFNPATVAPDYAGTIEAPIPYKNLSGILNPEVPLLKN